MSVRVSGPPVAIRGSKVDVARLRRRAGSILSAIGQSQSELSIALVDDVSIAELNGQWRGKPRPTDVLSFSLVEGDFADHRGGLLGDVVICPAILYREADELGKTPEAHWIHLLIHGVLHLLGYDHKTEGSAAIMEELEIDILEKLGFPNPYLVG